MLACTLVLTPLAFVSAFVTVATLSLMNRRVSLTCSGAHDNDSWFVYHSAQTVLHAFSKRTPCLQ